VSLALMLRAKLVLLMPPDCNLPSYFKKMTTQLHQPKNGNVRFLLEISNRSIKQ
jgi:hypothetical protein